MTSGATIRPMNDKDAGDIVALWQASGITRPWNDPMKDIAFARRGEHSTVLVADVSGGVVATAMVGEDGHRGWVYYVATDPNHRGAGLGRAMMRAAEQWLAARGVWKLQLLVREDNRQARKFYEKLGYIDTKSSCYQKVIQTPEEGGG